MPSDGGPTRRVPFEQTPLGSWVPPALVKIARRRRGSHSAVTWEGDYPDWASASAGCTGYDSEAIFRRVEEAAEQVESGAAVYERDSRVFDHVEYSWPLLASLLWVQASEGRLAVADFGGGLGSTWRQNRRFLQGFPDVRWGIVEQPRLVETGRRRFSKPPLSFHHSLEDCIDAVSPSLALFASSLCYVESPFGILEVVREGPFKHVIVDRTPFQAGSRDRLTIQRVPPDIYPASYPCWIFGETRFESLLCPPFEVVETWASEEHRPLPGANLRGMLLRRGP